MTQHKQTIQQTITLLQQAKHLLEKELQYDYSVTDEIEKIIESLEFDLGEEEAHQAYLQNKSKVAKLIAEEQTDKRISDALLKRYYLGE